MHFFITMASEEEERLLEDATTSSDISNAAISSIFEEGYNDTENEALKYPTRMDSFVPVEVSERVAVV